MILVIIQQNDPAKNSNARSSIVAFNSSISCRLIESIYLSVDFNSDRHHRRLLAYYKIITSD